MAGFNIVGKLAENPLAKIGKKEASPEKGKTVRSIKKQINEIMKEKSTLFGVIGMEAYDLYKAGKLEPAGLKGYFEKMEQLSEKMESLEEEKQQLEAKAQKNNICECGCKLSKNTKFCPNCGRAVESMKTEEDQAQNGPRECICGAKIMPGQFMCMECGRRVDQEKQI